MYKQINVKEHFGAKGDGVTDDTAAIQAAINAIPSAGGTIFIPIGNYSITDTLTIEDKGPLTIMGENSSVLLGSTSTMSSHIVPDASWSSTKAVFDVVSNSGNHSGDHGGITFKDITIRPYSTVVGYGINVRHGSGDTGFWGNILLDGVCLRYLNYGLKFAGAGSEGFGWIYVKNSRIEACNYGIYSDVTINNMVVRDSIIRQNTQSGCNSYTQRTGGGIILPYGNSLVIDGCDLEGQQVGLQTGFSNIVITGNYFEVNYDASIVLQSAQAVSIVGNYFSDDYRTGQIYMGYCQDVDIKANENVTLVLMESNQNIFCDTYSNAILSCPATDITTATQTVSNTSVVFYTEQGVTKLKQVGREGTKPAYHAPQAYNVNITQSNEGPLGSTQLVALVTATGSSANFVPYYYDWVSSSGLNMKQYSVTGSSDTFTSTTAHSFSVGEQVCFYTAGTLPSGISTAKWYYVKETPLTTTFKISTTSSGTNVSPSSVGVGTQYVTNEAEYLIESMWLKVPSTNTTVSAYIESRNVIHGVSSLVNYISTPPASVMPADKWLLAQIITKMPAGIVLSLGGMDVNTRIYQLTSGNSTAVCGVACTKTRNIFSTPKHLSYFTNVESEILQKIDDRHYIYTGAPTSTVFGWQVGTQIEYLTPTGGGHIGLVCTTSGAPGTWKTFGAITA